LPASPAVHQKVDISSVVRISKYVKQLDMLSGATRYCQGPRAPVGVRTLRRFKCRLVILILWSVVQERGYRLIFIAAVFWDRITCVRDAKADQSKW
jgi:hypothetical protein